MSEDLKETTTTANVSNTVGGGQVFSRAFPIKIKKFLQDYGNEAEDDKNENKKDLNETNFSRLFYEFDNS